MGVLPVAASQAAEGVAVRPFGQRADPPAARLLGEGGVGGPPVNWLLSTRKLVSEVLVAREGSPPVSLFPETAKR